MNMMKYSKTADHSFQFRHNNFLLGIFPDSIYMIL